MKRTVVSEIAGWDGSYLAELFLEKSYLVYGLAREESCYRPNCSSQLVGKVEISFFFR